ncbi:KAT8 regulatory NSL complex subunit 3 [Galendromus occidentalis]|uniref:KAT8 regulatory NSL complex subunit 3 n=1 Tax=Galendromus occidentalis TaxID=34638 RepID=A0AAJ6VYV7_9ACAR|nr:KAT8 regulatory NSL complex subunit 3 [Galendromus occidentalis]
MSKNFLWSLLGEESSAQQYQEADIVALDHAYARSWNSHPVSVHARPAVLLFVTKEQFHESRNRKNSMVLVDVESVSNKPQPVFYDQSKCKNMIDEVERHVRTQQKCIPDEIWDEDRVSRENWTRAQSSAFDRMYEILDQEKIARYCFESQSGQTSGFISRRTSLDKAARRVRQLFADTMWDQVLLQWLHSTIIENLPVSYCAIYVEILQTLNSKIPTLISKLFTRCSGGTFKQSIAVDSLLALLKRPWDPIAPLLCVNRPKKLPGPPVFIVVPSGLTQNPNFPRIKFWYNHLAHLGKLIAIPIPIVNEPHLTVAKQLEVTIGVVKNKVCEVKLQLPGRPIVLIGWNSGALVAIHTSLIESVSGVVCMGSPMAGLLGPKQLDDPILDSRTPVLFCVGQFDRSCSLDDLEDFRGYMKCETGVVVVGGADANLHMSNKHRRMWGLTQAMVDRCIVEELYTFLSQVLVNINCTPMSPIPPRGAHERKTEPVNSSQAAVASARTDGTPVSAPRKNRKRERSIDEDSFSYFFHNSTNKRGPGRPRVLKPSRQSTHGVKTSPVLEPCQTVTHAAATTATSVLTKELTQLKAVKPITAHVRASPTKNPISIGKLGSLSSLSQQGSLLISNPIRDEHRMVNPQDVLGMVPSDQ